MGYRGSGTITKEPSQIPARPNHCEVNSLPRSTHCEDRLLRGPISLLRSTHCQGPCTAEAYSLRGPFTAEAHSLRRPIQCRGPFSVESHSLLRPIAVLQPIASDIAGQAHSWRRPCHEPGQITFAGPARRSWRCPSLNPSSLHERLGDHRAPQSSTAFPKAAAD